MIAQPWEEPEPHSAMLGASFLRAAHDPERLGTLQIRLARPLLRHFARLGCAISKELSIACESADGADALLRALSVGPARRRDAEKGPGLVLDPSRAIRTITTSGSSGTPLSYGISASWRRAHHVTWRLAYSIMTEGWLTGYLDQRRLWAMARPPGGTRDNLPNTIEIAPEGGALRFSRPPAEFEPQVVHGSISTIIDALSSSAVASWQPAFVILTYEGATPSQLALVADAWPRATQHVEYAANDGGLSAFTCPAGRLHAWTMRSMMASCQGAARTIDLFNYACSFVAYENGDEVQISDEHCSCGLVLPTVKVSGRRADMIRLSAGRSISALCPFTTEELIGIRGIRVEIVADDRCHLVLVASQVGHRNLNALRERLHSYGLTVEEVRWVQSIAALNDRCKFRTVVDHRGRAVEMV